MPKPSEWTNEFNPAYAYYVYYIYTNLFTLNKILVERILEGNFHYYPFSSILDSGGERALVKEDLEVSMLEKCEQSLPVVQRIAETPGKWS
ncbi:hypothetical protein AgCh_008747 [Apium graveolens]